MEMITHVSTVLRGWRVHCDHQSWRPDRGNRGADSRPLGKNLMPAAPPAARQCEEPSATTGTRVVFRGLSNRSEGAAARNGLAETVRGLGRPHTHAVIDQDAVLTLARLAGNRLEQARAWQGLARARHELSYSRLAR